MFSVISCQGVQARHFLQGQLSCNLQTVSATQASPFTYCNAKGRVISSGVVFELDQQLHLLMPTSILALTSDAMKTFALFSRIELTTETASVALLMNEDQPTSTQVSRPTQPMACIKHEQGLLIRALGDTQRWFMISETPKASQPEIAHQWAVCDIEQRYAQLTNTTSGRFTPQMLGYTDWPGMVSFDKGCYLGQEVIARTQHLGRAKRRLAKIPRQPNLLPGSEIPGDNNRPIGTIINTLPNHPTALAIVHESMNEK